eukprot:979132-Pelagomonas_calceolata.AAC.3
MTVPFGAHEDCHSDCIASCDKPSKQKNFGERFAWTRGKDYTQVANFKLRLWSEPRTSHAVPFRPCISSTLALLLTQRCPRWMELKAPLLERSPSCKLQAAKKLHMTDITLSM